MSKWKIVKLGDICTLKSGKSLDEKIVSEQGDIPYIKVSDLSITNNFSRITCSSRYVDLKYVAKQLFPIGATIFPKRGGAIATNKKRITAREVCTDLNIMGVIPSAEIHPEYLFSYFQRVDLGILSNGSSVPQINNGDIAPLLIPLPPIEIQKKIAKTLDTTAELLAMRKQQHAELDNLIKSTFYDMFGDPVKNEKGWEQKTLSTFINKKRDISYGIVQRGPHVEGGVPIVRIRDIVESTFLESGLVRTTIENSNKYQRTILHGGEILLSIRGTIGKVAIAPPYSKGWNISREVAIIPVEGAINILFLENLLKSKSIQNVFQDMVKGVAQSGMNLVDIRNVKMIYPSSLLQTQFATIVTQIEEQKSLVKKAIEETKYLFDSLMSEYFE